MYITFSHEGPLENITTLRILVNSRLDFQAHINTQTGKAEDLLAVMLRLGKTNGGLPPGSLRAIFMGAIRPVFTEDTEIWHRGDRKVNLSKFLHIEYQALRKITGGYHESSYQKLAGIAAVESLESKLDDITWAARSLRTGDTEIRGFLDGEVAPGYTDWHDGPGRRGFNPDGSINGAFYLTPVVEPQARCYGDIHDTNPVFLTHTELLSPRDERSTIHHCGHDRLTCPPLNLPEFPGGSSDWASVLVMF